MTVSVEPNLSYDLEERSNGWLFRFPAGEEDALWRGPYPNRAAAEAAVLPIIEDIVAQNVKAILFNQ